MPAGSGQATDRVRQFQRRLVSQRIPISGMLDLTNRCNLRCVHCYLGPQKLQWAKRDQEMTTEQVLAAISDLAKAGCLFLTFTGGDPMLRSDFPTIYRYTRNQGLVVTVLCNGTLVSDEILETLVDQPPSAVEITLYGATKDTFEKVTGVRGSYDRCLDGIRRLVASGIRVKLKTVIITLNVHEVPRMRAMAEELGAPFRADSAIFPHLPDADPAPLQYRVDPAVAVACESGSEHEVLQWGKAIESRTPPSPSDRLFTCGAGTTGFYIDPFGRLSPCLMTQRYRYPLAGRRFDELWETDVRQIHSRRPRQGYECNSCEMQLACMGCPAMNELETGAEDVRSEYVCETTRRRWKRIEIAMHGDAGRHSLHDGGIKA